ncbi:CIC_collapsed_G0000870.mRNA.1.CDS.1 [Saccharomyces cerevisiae]|nr:CIC_collapsed_G0000870.mRNA.1.CDS.1 [Saccharomyces cerevisiae]
MTTVTGTNGQPTDETIMLSKHQQLPKVRHHNDSTPSHGLVLSLLHLPRLTTLTGTDNGVPTDETIIVAQNTNNCRAP